MTDVIAELRAELFRLGATYPTVSRVDEITVTDHRSGNIVLSGSPPGVVFYSPEEATVILDRLRKAPDDAGRVAVDGELLQRMIQPLADNARCMAAASSSS
jgi:hypothetical protein